jgi:hypothetical protein
MQRALSDKTCRNLALVRAHKRFLAGRARSSDHCRRSKNLVIWKQVRECGYRWADGDDPKTTRPFNERMRILSGFATIVNVCGDGGAFVRLKHGVNNGFGEATIRLAKPSDWQHLSSLRNMPMSLNADPRTRITVANSWSTYPDILRNATMEGFRFATDPDEPQAYSQPKYTLIVNDAPKFELASYISNYKGRTILTRLYLIASCCPPLREEATKLLVAEAKKGSDTTIYQDAVSLLNKFNPPGDGSTGLDMAWLEKREKQNAAETARLESELKGYKNNLIKESIRVSPSPTTPSSS